MERTAYRGVSYGEAQRVVLNQKYERNELREFNNRVAARSLFGQGIYLINDPALAAQYAFCHAEVEGDESAVVLSQKICFQNPFILNYQFSEARLRKEALRWKYAGKHFPDPTDDQSPLELFKQIGNTIKEFLLSRSNDGIIYHIDDEIIYYVLYDQEKQIKDIKVELVFKIQDSHPGKRINELHL
ncbi:hypothetical protein [Pseudobacillus wudalianchiensis]|uniref:Uncharacterized protein n=1 Tax=Pseudobacillus wudalianchiensis TaxID=1743143 RepID=A0A1B9AU77_9BACI|nr:hypothetical protein [Bacillus wudalianchiensis]OCA87218.1 hypothetical protein A8F95_08145 [Bacillus wudalianchiensis]